MPRVKSLTPDPREEEQMYLEGKSFTVEETAKILRVSTLMLQKQRLKKTGPRYVKVGHRSVRYLKKDLIDYMKDRHYASTSEDPTLIPPTKLLLQPSTNRKEKNL